MATATLAPLVKSKLKARAAVKGLSADEIQKIISNLTGVLKAEKLKEEKKAENAKKAKIAKIKALMEESGLDASDIQAIAGTRRKVRGKAKAKGKAKRKAAPKYRLVLKGEEYLWSGRGRPPKVFKDYMDSGKSKESCAI